MEYDDIQDLRNMIPPERTPETMSQAERRAEWEARKLAQTVLNAAVGIEKTAGVGSLAIVWDTIVVLLAVMRRESVNRGESWEEVEHRLNLDSAEMLAQILKDGGLRDR
jgi:hypothetical protein